MNNSVNRNGKSHKFGGDWTETKLKVIANYLKSYTTALKNTTFEKIYIDAFAGTGYREPSHDEEEENYFNLLTGDFNKNEAQELLDGSACIALKTDPRFDKFIFIESNSKRCKYLEQLKIEFPVLAQDLQILNEDANTAIQKICNINWYSKRAVLFLDPYGMQVNWDTIERIALTKAIDLWLLFPLGIGVNRLLRKSGDISIANRKKLDVFLGTTNWYNEFYSINEQKDLFDNIVETVSKCTMNEIALYYINRLKSIFVGVAERPGVLINSKNNPLYLLCFAVSNEKGKNIAMKIANHLLGKIAYVTKL